MVQGEDTSPCLHVDAVSDILDLQLSATVEPRLSEPRLSELSIIQTGADK